MIQDGKSNFLLLDFLKKNINTQNTNKFYIKERKDSMARRMSKENIKKGYELRMQFSLSVSRTISTAFLTSALVIFAGSTLAFNVSYLTTPIIITTVIYFSGSMFLSYLYIRNAHKDLEEMLKLLGWQKKR